MGLRIEHAPRNIDVGDRSAIEQKVPALKVVEKRKQRHEDSDARHAGRAAVSNDRCLCAHDVRSVMA